MPTATLTADDRLSIPENLRRQLGFTVGERLHLDVGPAKTLIVRPESADEEPSQLFGLLEHLAKDRPVSIEEMNDAVAEGAAERFRSATRR